MARNLSVPFLRAAYAQQTAEVPLQLLEFSDPAISTIRVVNNTEEVVSDGNTYSAFAFEIPEPSDREGETPRVTLKIDNIDRQIVEALRSIPRRPKITLKLVLASSPNIIEFGPYEMELKNASYDKLVVEGELGYEDYDDEPYPGDSFTPAVAPGLF